MSGIANIILDKLRKGEDGTLHAVDLSTPGVGYMVGGVSWTMTATPEHVDSEMVNNFIVAHWAMLQEPFLYVGWWTHEGRVYFDVAEHVIDRGYAHSLGVRRKEKAIWDLEWQEEIKCP